MNNLVTTGGPSLLDASYFTQVMSLAEVMASSSLLPKTLITGKDEGGKEIFLTIETVKANCFLIANQAFKWKADPFAVAAACSVVHGRLMFEGKLVHAILEANLGVKLRIAFGKWDSKKECCDLSEEGTGDNLAARIYEEVNGEMGKRFVDGYVGGWKTTGANTPWRQGNFRKQMLYRGSREWSRWFEPGIMIGVITDDEIDVEPKDITPKAESSTADGVLSRLKAKKTIDGEGFDADRVKTETQESADTTRTADDEADISRASSDDRAAGEESTAPAAASSTDQNRQEDDSTDRGDGAAAEEAGSAADEKGSSQASSAASQDKTTAGETNAPDGAVWLQNITKMLWAATFFNGDANVLKAQRKAAAASYPHEGVQEKWTKKAGSVFDRCMDIVSGALEPEDGQDMIAGLAGIETAELAQIWKKRG